MRILDIGALFKNPVSQIFDVWPGARTFVLPTIKEIEAYPEKIDLVCFGGGMDIHPSLYGHQNVASNCENSPSARDMFEMQVWRHCQKNSIPVLGICRGSQFVCAMSGGELIQDIGWGHGMDDGHMLKTIDGQLIKMTSTHHQMMYPNRAKFYEVLAWLDERRTGNYSFDNTKIKSFELKGKEPEIVYFQKTNALAVQGHPEYMNVNHESVAYIRELVDRYLLGDQH